MKMKKMMGSTAIVAVAAMAVGILVAMGVSNAMQATRTVDIPAAKVISFGDGIGRLNTVTGAIHQLSGNLSNASARVTWQQRVPPVAGTTSGYLDIQQTNFNSPGEMFLVDTITGDTWIFRWRASGHGSWDAIRVE